MQQTVDSLLGPWNARHMQNRKSNRVGRPKSPLISRDVAARIALQVICEDGMQAFSLNSVAQRLGVKTPSLYYHFSDKWELLAEVARLLLTDAHQEVQKSDDWETRVIRICVAARRSLLRYPQAAPLMLEFFPRHLLLSAYNDMIPYYAFAPELHVIVMEGTEKLTFGSGLFAASALARGVPPMPDFDKDQFPHLANAIAVNPYDEEETFEQTVRIFLKGVKIRAEEIRIEKAAQQTDANAS
jgi:AcrR family transcriptional regulator